MYRVAPLCPECEYYPLCHKYGDYLPETTCGEIYNTIADWEDEHNDVITENLYCALLGIKKKHGMYNRNCLHCNTSFFTTVASRLFCSLECKQNYNTQLRREALVCQNCGKHTETENSCFCSADCRMEFIKKILLGVAKLQNPEQEFLFSNWLRGKLDEKGLSQNMLARQLKVSKAIVTKWLNGSVLPPRKGAMLIAGIFDTDVLEVENMIMQDIILSFVRGGKTVEKS